MPEREHGSRAKYVWEDCRCFPCRVANARYAEELNRKHLYGIPVLVDTDALVLHIEALRKAGIGDRAIAAAAGVERKTVRDIRLGDTKRVKPETEEAIARIDVNPERWASDNSLIDATKTWRRIHALEALGYPKAWIAQQAGLGRAIQLDQHLVMAKNARRIKRLADDIGDRWGPSLRIRQQALRKGYKVPGWYDDDFDLPEKGTSELTLKQEEVVERRDRVAALTRVGRSASEIASELGVAERTIVRDRVYNESNSNRQSEGATG